MDYQFLFIALLKILKKVLRTKKKENTGFRGVTKLYSRKTKRNIKLDK